MKKLGMSILCLVTALILAGGMYAARAEGIESEVDEHTKPIVRPPRKALGLLL